MKINSFIIYLLLTHMVYSGVTLNQKDMGFRGIWYKIDAPSGSPYVYKYSGGLGTYCAKHRPFAIYRPEVDKTFFCYGGTSQDSNTELWHMVSYYDHQTGQVALPTILLDKQTSDAHDNPIISVDGDGYIWIFSPDHGGGSTSYIHKSVLPYDIDEFVQVNPTRIDDGDNVVIMDNFSYPQAWHEPGQGFSVFFTKYGYPVSRTICFMTSVDGAAWSKWQRISTIGAGSYQVSCRDGSRASTAFNIHPVPGGLDHRTNLYYVETRDNGQTWQAVDGTPLTLPLTDSVMTSTPALVRNYQSEGLLVYMKDIMYDPEGNPVILYLTSYGYEPGPENGPRTWMIAHWSGTEWQYKPITTSDNNYDAGSLYIESDGTWRLIGATEPGPQDYNTGGELAIWTSADQGNTWNKIKDMTQNSVYNHSFVRAPLNAQDDFYGIWADGHGREPSKSCLYYCDKAGNVTQLPRGEIDEECRSLPPYDLNRDCHVNLQDFSQLAANWLKPGTFFQISDIASDIDEDFEVDNVGQLNGFTLMGSSPAISSTISYSGNQSLTWPVDSTGMYTVVPFGREQVHCTASVRVYLNSETAAGRSCFSIYDQSGAYIMLILDKDPTTGQFNLLHRFNSSLHIPSLTHLDPGWHQMGFVIHDNGATGLYFDEQYIDTSTVISGLFEVRFGKPWSTYSGGDVYYDKLMITPNNAFIGGGDRTASDIFEDFESYWSTSDMSEAGYVVTGSPAIGSDRKRSGDYSFRCPDGGYGKAQKDVSELSFNCRYSVWVNLPSIDTGRGYAGVEDENGNYCLIITDKNPTRVYYRFKTTSYPGFNIVTGWHLMSFIIDYQGDAHLFFDNTYLDTYRDISGLKGIRFGIPWSTAGYSYFDAATLVHDIRGGFCGDWNTIFLPGDFNQDCIEDIDDLGLLVDKWLLSDQ